MSKGIYRLFLVVGNMVVFGGIVAVIAADGGISAEEIGPLMGPVLLLAAVVHLVFIYRFWSSIQDGSPRMSPGKAVGFLFIPIFNIYWIFQVYGGFATDFNRYIESKGIQTPRLSQGLLVFNVILMFLALPILNWIIFWIVIGKICDGANAASSS